MSLFVFLAYLAVGVALTLPLVRLGPEGRRFYLFCEALALGSAALASVLRALPPSLSQAAPALSLGGHRLALFAVFTAGLIVLVLAELLARPTAGLKKLVAAVGIAALLADSWQLHRNTLSELPGAAWLHPLNALGGAWLAGSILVAMILGHYYLIMPGASTEPLMKIFRFALTGLIARFGLVLAVAIIWWTTRPAGPVDPARLLTDGVFIAQRVLFGLVLPASLAYFTWKTILIRSTQSATGILYVVVFLTLVGEALSVYLSLATRMPI